MIKRIAHIGIAVKKTEDSAKIFSQIFNTENPHTEIVEEQKAKISFYPVGESAFELIESTAVDSSITKFIEKKGEGIHHICLEVENLEQEIARLKKLGFQFVNEEPKLGGDGYRIAFLHPKSTNGVLIELCEKQ